MHTAPEPRRPTGGRWRAPGRAHRAAALAIAALAVAGCTGDDDEVTPTTEASTTSTSVVEAPVDLSDAYFASLLDGETSSNPAAPGSDAARYAAYRRSARRLVDARDVEGVPAGTSATAVPTAAADGSYRICDPDCTDFDDVATDPGTGQVVTFSIDGVPLAGRVAGAGVRADVDGLIARVTSAYRNTDGDLLVVVEIVNATEAQAEVAVFGFGAVYQPAGTGTGVETSGAWGDPDVAPGATTELLLAFPARDDPGQDAVVEGLVSMTGLRDDGVDVRLDITVPSPGA